MAIAQRQRARVEKGMGMEAFDELEREGVFVGVLSGVGAGARQGVGMLSV